MRGSSKLASLQSLVYNIHITKKIMAETKLYFLMAKLLKLDYYIVTINNISIGLWFTSDYAINTIGNLGFGVEIVAFAVY